ncbi:MAG: hypothetical protein HY403_05955 [Elusimicrobia bacterium]|nr:hypothetical protein [Elusimicrobiota bacterium]
MAQLDIDYPQQDQIVTSPTYTFRVGGPETLATLEVSVDRGPWRACRRACGYWWHDWSGYGDGEHTLVARGQNRDGSPAGSTPRRFTVALRK